MRSMIFALSVLAMRTATMVSPVQRISVIRKRDSAATHGSVVELQTVVALLIVTVRRIQIAPAAMGCVRKVKTVMPVP
jgi:hypothetical protein